MIVNASFKINLHLIILVDNPIF